VRKVLRTFLLAILILIVAINAPAILVGVKKLINKGVFLVHVTELYAQAPDERLEMPVAGITKNQIADTWHVSRDKDRLHEGLDIFARRGTPILSATDGYVLRIGENDLGGLTVSVLGAGGRVYYYAHLDSYAPNLSSSDHVTTQTVLGYVGNTGNAAGGPTHLHFGVYGRDGALNPKPLLNDRPKEADLNSSPPNRTR
jgi:murein DD-endopeptidase MepM/ murein hydrolase activator NlpD